MGKIFYLAKNKNKTKNKCVLKDEHALQGEKCD
jgi:hypothetical protein